MSEGRNDRPVRLLRVTHTLRSESGGPSESVRRSTLELLRLGHHVEVVSLDPPGMDETDPKFTIHMLGEKASGYGHTAKLEPWLREHRDRFDAVLIHGLWQYQGWGTRRGLAGGNTPYLVFPHGMLDPWFKKAYPLKHWKKQLYWWMREHRVLSRAAAVCFTCEEEKELARQSFRPYKIEERVVAYGTADPSGDVAEQIAAWTQFCPELSGKPFLLYLGRIHSKKGVDLLLRAYARVWEQRNDAPALVVAGPIEGESYGEGLKRLAERECPTGSVFWPGMLTGDIKWGAMRSCEAFCLTSHQENFGIAVAEAMACGRPVLISRQVNIWREVVGDGGGFARPDDLAGAVALLTDWAQTDEGTRLKMGRGARVCFEARYEIKRAAESLVSTVREFLPASK
jgi:glycosyltransferase involved in cell wall biosynthesis